MPGGLGGAFNAGTQKVEGVELAIQKGDPSHNGWSGQLSYTYTFSRIKYALINGSNVVTTELANLQEFYDLTKNGGGAPCYDPKTGPVKDCSKDPIAIANPYYNLLPEMETFSDLASLLPPSGWYPTYANYFRYGLQTGDSATALSPNIFSGFISYKHNRLQAAVTTSLWEGAQYGSPTDTLGLDPRSCLWNQSTAGVKAGSQLADYQVCGAQIAIPSPFTGQFTGIGQFREPWELNIGGQLAYDLSPRIRVTASIANILNACFGGSAEPWTLAYPPNSVDCGYYPNSTYVGWSPGETWNTAGAGYFYGSNPHSAINGHTVSEALRPGVCAKSRTDIRTASNISKGQCENIERPEYLKDRIIIRTIHES